MSAYPTELINPLPRKSFDPDRVIAWIHTITVPLITLLALWHANGNIGQSYCVSPAAPPIAFIPGHWSLALMLGGIVAAGSHWVWRYRPGTLVAKLYNGFAAMAMCMLFMHFGGGSGEAHFPFFIFLSFLVYYRDWRPIAFGVLVILTHHLLFFELAAHGWPVVIFTCLDYETLLTHIAAGAGQGIFLGFIAERLRSDETTLQNQADDLRKLSSAIEQNPTAILITDIRGVIEYANPKFYEVTGFSVKETLGKTPSIMKSELNSPALYEAMWNALSEGESWVGEFTNRRKNGELFWCTEHLTPLENTKGQITHYLAMIENIDARKHAEEMIRQLAYFDPLTDLPNRRHFNELLNQNLLWAGRAGCRCAVIYLDLDHFKEVNDTLGHDAGDVLLKQVASRLQHVLREGDIVSRLGGDEFVVLLNNLVNAADAGQVAEKIVQVMREPISIGEYDLSVTASLGIAMFPDDNTDPNELVKFADIALYDAKRLGKNQFCFYSAETTRVSLHRLETEAALRYAVAREEMFIEYQPQHHAQTRDIFAVEALVRWNHPVRGRLPPAEFIPLAEDSQLIIELGEWVLRRACRDVQAISENCRVAVNVSAKQFHRADFSDKVQQILKETGLPPHRLELELTESALIEDPEMTIRNLIALRTSGVTVALDDFGTGYSSLSYLKQFPVSVIKIDRSFIMDLVANPKDQAIARAIIDVARSLNMKIVAEGIENEAQAEMLTTLGADLLQGFLLSMPTSLEICLKREDIDLEK